LSLRAYVLRRSRNKLISKDIAEPADGGTLFKVAAEAISELELVEQKACDRILAEKGNQSAKE